jgi:hypothetical protein
MTVSTSLQFLPTKAELRSFFTNLNTFQEWLRFLENYIPSNDDRDQHSELLDYIQQIANYRHFSMDFYLPSLNITDEMKNEFRIRTGGIGQGPNKQLRLKDLAEEIFAEFS